MASNYQIKIKSVVDTSGIQADLDKVASKYTLKIKTDIGQNLQSDINKATSSVKTNPVKVNIDVAGAETLSVVTKEVANGVNTITTKTKELGTAFDKVVETTKNAKTQATVLTKTTEDYASAAKRASAEQTASLKQQEQMQNALITTERNRRLELEKQAEAQAKAINAEQVKAYNEQVKASNIEHQKTVNYLAQQRTEQEKLTQSQAESYQKQMSQQFGMDSTYKTAEEARQYEMLWDDLLTKQDNQIKQYETSQQNLLNNISRLQEGSLSKYADQEGLSSLSRQVQELDTTSKNYKQSLSDLNVEYGKYNTAAKNAKDAATAQTRATKENLFSLNNFSNSMKTAIVRTIEWASAMTLFYGSLRAIQAMIDVVIELDSAMTEYQKVSDLTGESMDAFVAKATEAGQSLAKTGTEMVEAATEFKKSGYSDEDALFLAEVASMYTNIADEQLSAGESAEFIIAQMEAFNIAASDSMQIIDALNEVSNNYAVSSADLTLLGRTYAKAS